MSKMDKYEEKKSDQLPAAALFKFAISFPDLEKVAERLPDKVTIKAILVDIQKEIVEIESFFPLEDPDLYYPEIRDRLDAISRSLGEIPEKSGFYHSIRTKIQGAINPLQKDIRAFFLQEEGVSDSQLIAKTQALYAQQALIMRDETISKALNNTLQNIQKQLPKAQKGLRCFISYAWPTAELQQKEYWLQPFLRVLHKHLTQAGIKPRLDIVDNIADGNIITFTDNIKTDEFAVLICTESLANKHHHPQFRVVQMELNLLQQKYDADIRVNPKPRVFPFLVSGSRVSASLPQHNLYHTVRDWRVQSYLKNLEQLIGWMCYPQGVSETYQEIWQDFYTHYPALTSPMPEERVKQELASRWHQDESSKLEKEAFYQGLLNQQPQLALTTPSKVEEIKESKEQALARVPVEPAPQEQPLSSSSSSWSGANLQNAQITNSTVSITVTNPAASSPHLAPALNHHLTIGGHIAGSVNAGIANARNVPAHMAEAMMGHHQQVAQRGISHNVMVTSTGGVGGTLDAGMLNIDFANTTPALHAAPNYSSPSSLTSNSSPSFFSGAAGNHSSSMQNLQGNNQTSSPATSSQMNSNFENAQVGENTGSASKSKQ